MYFIKAMGCLFANLALFLRHVGYILINTYSAFLSTQLLLNWLLAQCISSLTWPTRRGSTLHLIKRQYIIFFVLFCLLIQSLEFINFISFAASTLFFSQSVFVSPQATWTIFFRISLLIRRTREGVNQKSVPIKPKKSVFIKLYLDWNW